MIRYKIVCMHLSVSIARREPLLIEASADVAGGWRRNERGFGFFARGGIPYLGDRGLEFTLNVRVHPYRQVSHFASFPESLEKHGFWGAEIGAGAYDICRGRAVVLVALDALRDVLEQRGEAPFHFAPVILVEGPQRSYIQMNVSARVVPAPPSPIGDVREWDTQFYQGGLPSLGKRRP